MMKLSNSGRLLGQIMVSNLKFHPSVLSGISLLSWLMALPTKDRSGGLAIVKID